MLGSWEVGVGVGVGLKGFGSTVQVGVEGLELGLEGFKSEGWGWGGQRSWGVGRIWVELRSERLWLRHWGRGGSRVGFRRVGSGGLEVRIVNWDKEVGVERVGVEGVGVGSEGFGREVQIGVWRGWSWVQSGSSQGLGSGRSEELGAWGRIGVEGLGRSEGLGYGGSGGGQGRIKGLRRSRGVGLRRLGGSGGLG